MTSKSRPIHPDWAKSEAKRCEAMNEKFRIAMHEAHPNIREGVVGPDPGARPRRVLPADANPGWTDSQLGDF